MHQAEKTTKTGDHAAMRATFVRHGQSTGNVGIPCDDITLIELTEVGREQAECVAAEWTEEPSLIVTSPFLRTRQTAEPTIRRFPGVPVETWPVEEFTYLQPARWNGSLSADRAPFLERYWRECDPGHCDGEGAESFGAMLRRVEAALARLAALPPDSVVHIFSHGQFIQAVRSVVVDVHLDDRGRMAGFWKAGEPPVIANAQRVGFEFAHGRWTLDGTSGDEKHGPTAVPGDEA